MNSRIQKFVIVRLPFRLACACAPMVAFAAAACAPPTEGASNHTAPSATAANALRAADVGLEYETWQRGGGEAPESFAGYAARVRAGSDAEHATWAASKLPVDPDNAGAQNVVRARDVHDLVRRAAAEPDRVFTVMAHVPEPDFDWPEFRRRDISDESREEMRSAREGQVAEAVAELEGSVVREGGELRSRFWLIPAFEFVASGATVLRIAALPGYTVMHEVLPVDIKPMEGYDGVELRSGTQVASMISSGYRGQAGGRTGGAVRVAIAEGDVLLGHPGYKRPNSTSRLVAQYECDDTSCFAPTHFLDANGHGNSVTRIAAGSIEGGQDALVPLATDRVQRSGIAPETNIYHVMVAPNTTGWTGHAKMVEKMTSIGADVANHSYGAGCGAGSYCADATMEAALHNSHLAGVLHVAAAGNDPTEICYPAASRDVIAVGALDSNDGTAYATSDMSPISGTGGVAIITAGNYHTGPVAIVDLAAPGNADFWYGKTGATYNYWPPASG